MTTPLPLGLAPYISPATLQSAPTGVDWTSIPVSADPNCPTAPENSAELWHICGRATSRADGYCNQILRATTDVELCHGPDYRVTVGPAAGGFTLTPYWGLGSSGNARIILSRWPILQVTQVQVCPNNVWPRTWTTLPSGWAEPERPPIDVYGSSAPTGEAAAGQAILVGPGYIDWSLGRNGYAIQVQYTNGWPHASLTSAVAAGVTSLPVNDCTGWAVTTYSGLYTGARGVVKDAGQQETFNVTASSVTAGPGNLTLAAATNYPHPAGTIVTTMSASVEQACILFATAEALTRGATTTTIHDIGGHAQSIQGDGPTLAVSASY